MSKLQYELAARNAAPITDVVQQDFRPNILNGYLPEAFDAEAAKYMLPVLTTAELRQLKELGWSRIGAPITITNQGRLLMAKLKPSAKLPDGGYAPPSETFMGRKTDEGSWIAESPRDTYARGIREELGIDPNRLKLKAREKGAWSVSVWPVGATDELSQTYLFGVAPSGIISDEGLRVLEEFTQTDEVETIMFMTPEEIYGLENLREGTLSWLDSVVQRGLHADDYDSGINMVFSPVDVASPGIWSDINLRSIDT